MHHRARRPLVSSRRRAAFTLVELLVACGILVVLGGGLVALLNQGMALWRTAEQSGRLYDQARLVLDQLARDLRSTVVRSRAQDDEVFLRFICDADPRGRQRLRLVRTISGETAHPVLRHAGRRLAVKSPAVYDGRSDAEEASAGLLAPPGGTMEVFYALDPREDASILWRGVRAPIGGAGSLFHQRTIEEGPEAAEEKSRLLGPAADRPGEPDPYGGVPFRDAARPLTSGVMFLGFSFWGPTTNTWDPLAKPLAAPRAGQRSGPLTWWDSTRAILDRPGGPEELAFRRRADSLGDPTDDVFPEMAEVTLVLEGDDDPLGVRLAADLDAKGTRIELSRPLPLPDDPRDRFVRIGSEWIAVESGADRTLRIAGGGRGARDTLAGKHAAGSRVRLGITFRRVIEIPGPRRAWPGEDASGKPKSLLGGR
jgi:hypothetical protein